MNEPLIIHAPARTSVIGLDTSQTPARLVVTLLEDRTPYPDPVEKHTFHCLSDFVDAWSNSICDWEACVAVPRAGADPLGIRAWLEAQGQLLERYEWMDYRDHGGLGLAGLPIEFERPYVLALYAAYRRQAGSRARGLLAQLFEAQYLLEGTRREMHRLAAALSAPVPEPDLSLEDLPF